MSYNTKLYFNNSGNQVDIGSVFCDLTNNQTVGGTKTFSSDATFTSNVTINTAGKTLTVGNLAVTTLTGNPNFSGTPTISSNAIATQSYVTGLGYLTTSTASSTYAPLNSPNFTGTPQIGSVNIATQSYVTGLGYLTSSTASSTYAPLSSPNFSGTPQIGSVNIATQSYVTGLGYLTSSTASSTYAPLSSPNFTGTMNITTGNNSGAYALKLNGGLQYGGISYNSTVPNLNGGFGLGWNSYNATQGRTELYCCAGLGVGGFDFFAAVANATNWGTPIASLDNTGNLSVVGSVYSSAGLFIRGTGGNTYAGYIYTINGNAVKYNSPTGHYFNIISPDNTSASEIFRANASGVFLPGTYGYKYNGTGAGTVDNHYTDWMAFYHDNTGVYKVADPGNTICYAGLVIGNGYRILLQGGEIDITSDVRIKTNIVSIETASALDAIKKIRPVHFNLIENPTYLETGFIAQETKDYIPASISTDTHYIPNIMSMGDVVQISDNSYQIALRNTFDASGIVVPVKVKILNGGSNIHDYIITEINNVGGKQCLTVELIDETDGDRERSKLVDVVFVRGTYVDDFLLVNKNVIFTYAVSALQQLNTNVEQLTQENIELKNEVQSMKDDIQSMKDEIAKMTLIMQRVNLNLDERSSS